MRHILASGALYMSCVFAQQLGGLFRGFDPRSREAISISLGFVGNPKFVRLSHIFFFLFFSKLFCLFCLFWFILFLFSYFVCLVSLHHNIVYSKYSFMVQGFTLRLHVLHQSHKWIFFLKSTQTSFIFICFYIPS